MADELTIKVCRYINENFRPRYKSNREFADSCGVDEKTMRLIQEENYNLSLLLFQRICDSQSVKMSEILAKIGK
jgi:DNA-binding XRE family transcriptional regulator